MPHFSVHPLFARLCVVSRVTIHRLANNAIQKKQLARTDSLFIPGETATHMYIVVYGRPWEPIVNSTMHLESFCSSVPWKVDLQPDRFQGE